MVSSEADRPSIVNLAISNGVPKRSLYATLVVGTILNLIKQGDALFAGQALDFGKLSLTYMVPYCVATYGAVHAILAANRVKSAV